MNECRRRLAQGAAGLGVGLTGLGLMGVGLWARRETRQALSRERIVAALAPGSSSVPVTSASAARSLAEVIRQTTVKGAGGRTYSETDLYLAAGGGTTSDPSEAVTDERTGRPLENPDVALWVQSTTFQTALMQAYLAFRLADLSLALGASLVAAGAGIAAGARA